MTSDRSRSARVRNVLPYAALFLCAAYLYANAGQFAQMARPGELGPEVWPRAVLVVLMLVCGGAIVRDLLFVRAPRGASIDATAADATPGEPIETLAEAESASATHPFLLLGGIALSIAYVAALEWLGFFVDTALYLGIFMALGRYRRIGILLATSVIGSLAFVFVFMRVVYVSLPLGVGPFKAISVTLLALLGVR